MSERFFLFHKQLICICFLAGFLSCRLESTTPSFQCGDKLIDDRDGQNYTTFKSGSQCWMGQNLNSGRMILGDGSTGSFGDKFCHTNSEDSCNKYGGLYTWFNFKDDTSICPRGGWHIPSDFEWAIMESLEHGIPEDLLFKTLQDDRRGIESKNLYKPPFNAAYIGVYSPFWEKVDSINRCIEIPYFSKASKCGPSFWTFTNDPQNSGKAYLRGTSVNKSDDFISRSTGVKSQGLYVRCVKNI